MRLDFKTDGFWFFASFNLTEPVSSPPTFEQIGGFRQASYRPLTEQVPLRVWGNSPGSTATLTAQSVPTAPETLLPLAFGLALIVGYRWRTRCVSDEINKPDNVRFERRAKP
jgi:hypothetical protein